MSTTAPSCSPGRASCPRENRRGPPSSISKEQVAPSEPALEQAKPRISLRQPPANDRAGAASRRRHPVAVVDARDPWVGTLDIARASRPIRNELPAGIFRQRPDVAEKLPDVRVAEVAPGGGHRRERRSAGRALHLLHALRGSVPWGGSALPVGRCGARPDALAQVVCWPTALWPATSPVGSRTSSGIRPPGSPASIQSTSSR